jgi:hypothetical protein
MIMSRACKSLVHVRGVQTTRCAARAVLRADGTRHASTTNAHERERVHDHASARAETDQVTSEVAYEHARVQTARRSRCRKPLAPWGLMTHARKTPAFTSERERPRLLVCPPCRVAQPNAFFRTRPRVAASNAMQLREAQRLHSRCRFRARATNTYRSNSRTSQHGARRFRSLGSAVCRKHPACHRELAPCVWLSTV